MKIIKATWENRNLGCDAYEIKIEWKDFKNFQEVIDELKRQDFSGAYVTVKMPVGNLKALHALEDAGFRFMETQFSLKLDLTNYETPKMLLPFLREFERIEVEKTKEAWQKIVDMITPDMFTTDRIYLDPLLPQGVSCVRYKNWMMDLVERPDAHLFVCKDGKDVLGYGLDIYDEKKKTVYGLLGGVFEKFQGEGYGLLQWDHGFRENKKKGFVSFGTEISSNNQSVMDVYMFFGNKITKQVYVLRKKFD